MGQHSYHFDHQLLGVSRAPVQDWSIANMTGYIRPLVSSMLAPAVPSIMEDFHTSSTTFPTFVVSIFVLGFACGPLLLAPLSELYGRVIVYHVTNVLFIVFTVMCAVSKDAAMLLTFRFLSGFAGVATITIGPGTVADLMPREQRGRAVSIWAVGTVIGPIIGPIIGGFVTEVADWRWTFWILSITVSDHAREAVCDSLIGTQMGVVTIIALVILRETYHPVLLERKAARLRKETGDPRYRSRLASNVSPRVHIVRSVMRPSRMLLFCPAVTLLSIYVAVVYGIWYLFFATFSIVFKEVYGFSTFTSGLVFIACGIGSLSGLIYLGHFSDKSLRKRTTAGKTGIPEDRLPYVITLPGAFLFPIGIFIYGWGVEAHIHWIVPQFGTALTGFGYMLIFTAIQTYLIDAFEAHSASVVGATAVLRGIAGALIPLSGLDLYNALGWGWGNSLLAFVSLALAPLLLIFHSYGANIRISSRYSG